MRVEVDKRIEKTINRFSVQEKSRIARVVSLFKDQGFLLTETHLKKLTRDIWELRAGNIRLLFGVTRNLAVIVVAFRKKSQQTPISELSVAERRWAEYL